MLTKKIQLIISVVFMLSILLVCKQEVSVKKNVKEQPIAKVQYIKGQVKIERNGTIENVKVHTFLQMNDIITTEENSVVDIIVKGKGIIRIGANSRIEMKSLNENNIEIFQNSGTLITHLKKLKQNESYSVITPTSVAAVRGTSFIVKVKGHETTDIALVEGKLELKNQKGESLVMDQPGEISIQKEMKLTKKQIRPLSRRSLEILKELAAQDKGNVQEYVSFLQELRNSSAFKDLEVEANYEEQIEEAKKVSFRKPVQKIQSAEENVIKRNIKKDPLKIPPSRDFK